MEKEKHRKGKLFGVYRTPRVGSNVVIRLFKFLNSRIQFKIILPFAALTLGVASLGTYLSTNLFAESLEERFSKQLIDATDITANALAEREQQHLSHLRSIAFTEGINTGIEAGDQVELQRLVFPEVANNNIARVDVINQDGVRLLTISRPPGRESATGYTSETGPIEMNWAVVNEVLYSVPDERGDKRVAILNIEGNQLFVTGGPVRQDEVVVGAILVSSYLRDILPDLQRDTRTDINFHNLAGQVIATTLNTGDNSDAAQLLAIPEEDVHLLLTLEGQSSPQRSISIGNIDYDILPGIFWARGEPLGFYSIALETTGVVDESQTLRLTMFLIFGGGLLLVFGIGYVTSRMITNPVQNLMENAVAVAEGDLTRRANISSNDEIGSLAHSLNYMTSTLQKTIYDLTHLYESSKTITSTVQISFVLDAIISSIRALLPDINHVVIYLLDEKHQQLTPMAPALNGTNPFPIFSFEEQGRIDNLLAQLTPQLIQFSELEPYSLNGAGSQLFRENITSLIVPLMAGQETVGMITLTFMSDSEVALDTYVSEESERLLGTFANQAAVAIKNAQLFEAQQKAYQDLQELDRLKTEFIKSAAHELRTPLGAIMGHASSVAKRVPDKLSRRMNSIIISSERMRTMIDAMLSIQDLEAGTAYLRLAPTDIRKIIEKVAADYQPMAELEDHEMKVMLLDDLPIINIDPDKSGLIFSNLISNAIKFTPAGGVIEIAAQDYGDSILVTVSDDGIGLSPEDQAQIFEQFYQVRAANRAEGANLGVGAGHGGLGIGLTIVKHMVDLHKGQVWVESELGKGSTFFVTLPKEETSEKSDTVETAVLQT